MSSPKKVSKSPQTLKDPQPKRELSPKKLLPENSKTNPLKKTEKPITPINGPIIKEIKEPSRVASKQQLKDQQNPSNPKEESPKKLNSFKSLPISEEIEYKIKSRKRILDSLEEKTSFVNEELLLELSSRDYIIEEQNKEIILLKTKLKQSKTKNQEDLEKPSQSLKTLSELETEKQSLENKILVMTDKHRNNIQKLEEEKASFDIIQETMTEEIELLRTQLKNKEEEIHNIIEDIKKLSEIISQFKVLNHELNTKIEKQNSDYENMNNKFYEAQIRTANLDDLENNLQDYIRIYQQSEARSGKIAEELRTLQVLYDDIQSFCMFCEEKLEEIEKKMTEDDPSLAILKNLRNQLLKKKKIDVPEVNENAKDVKIRELNEKLEESYREIKRLQAIQKPLTEQIEAKNQLLETLRTEHILSIENLNKTIKSLQEFTDAQKSEIQGLRSENSKKDLKLTNFASKLANADNKLSLFEDKLRKVSESKNSIEKELSDYKIKASLAKPQIQERQNQINILEKQNSKYVLNIQALHEEF